MNQPIPRQRGSLAGPIILIALGVIFFLFTLYPDFNPWPVLFRYLPLILIMVGLGIIWDRYYAHHRADSGAPPAAPLVSGVGIAWILLLAFFIAAAWHGGARWRDGAQWRDDGWNGRWVWHGRTFGDYQHDTQAVEL